MTWSNTSWQQAEWETGSDAIGVGQAVQGVSNIVNVAAGGPQKQVRAARAVRNAAQANLQAKLAELEIARLQTSQRPHAPAATQRAIAQTQGPGIIDTITAPGWLGVPWLAWGMAGLGGLYVVWRIRRS